MSVKSFFDLIQKQALLGLKMGQTVDCSTCVLVSESFLTVAVEDIASSQYNVVELTFNNIAQNRLKTSSAEFQYFTAFLFCTITKKAR